MGFFKKTKQNIKARLSNITKKPQFYSILFQLNDLERKTKSDSQFVSTEQIRVIYHGIHISLEEAYSGFKRKMEEENEFPKELQSASWGIVLWSCSSIEQLLKNSPWICYEGEKSRDLVIVETDEGHARIKIIDPNPEMDEFMEKLKDDFSKEKKESDSEIKSIQIKIEDIDEIPEVIKSIIQKEIKKRDKKKDEKPEEILGIPIEVDLSSKKEKENKDLIQSILKKKDKKLLEDSKDKLTKEDYEYLEKRINEKS